MKFLNKQKKSLDDTVDEIEQLAQAEDDGDDFEHQKTMVYEIIAGTLQKTEYKYLEFLYHILTECIDSISIENGCPLNKCKKKFQMTYKELKEHLQSDCAKILLECSLCKGTMRLPWKKFHDCRKEYISKMDERDKKIAELEDAL